MAELHKLVKVCKKEKKRRGRGTSSGVGGTSGRGHKGQKARAGKKISPWFEGGQTPLHRRLPKRGFRNPFSVRYEVVNVGELNRFEDETIIDDNLLRKSSLANRKRKIKILGDGELEKRLIIKGLMTSKKAKEKIESKGGRVDYD
ncbi:50S ribosomal protein L15 [candidate division WOR-3 bacterium]|nr:50S ribosomal protein L15 [candidate division WOR-3 bacterium]